MNGDYGMIKKGHFWHYRFSVDGIRFQKSTRMKIKREAEEVALAAYRDALIRSHGDKPWPTMTALVGLWLEANGNSVETGVAESVETIGRLYLYGLRDLLVCEVTYANISNAGWKHIQSHSDFSPVLWRAFVLGLVSWGMRGCYPLSSVAGQRDAAGPVL